MDKVLAVLSIVGGVVVALPVLLHSIRLFLMAIPGDPGDAAVAKVEALAQKLADMISSVLPKPKV